MMIYIDCDGVLLDWETHFENWMEDRGYKKIDNYDVTAYGLHIHYGIPKKEIKELIKTFNESSAIGFCPAYHDAQEVIPRLYKDGYRFTVITSLSADPYSRLARISNLKDKFGDVFDDVICLDVGADKDEILAEMRAGSDYWVEDKYENAVVGAELGYETYLIEHEHNKYLTDFDKRVKLVADWFEIENHLRANK